MSLFIDTEIDANTERILNIGCIKGDGTTFHSLSHDFINGAKFLSGHNFLKHDLPILTRNSPDEISNQVIDTLYLSPQLFPSPAYNVALVKDDKINPDGPNNPLNDALKARDLLYDEVNAFYKLDERTKRTFYRYCLNDKNLEHSLNLSGIKPEVSGDATEFIRLISIHQVCENAQLEG